MAKNIVLNNLEHERAEKRFNRLLSDLAEEQKAWVTLENMDEIITPLLFDAPSATTGLITKQSDNWKFFAYPDSFERLVAETRAKGGIAEDGSILPDERWKFALHNSSVDENWEARQAEVARARSEDIIDLEQELNDMIGSPEERENFKTLVQDYVKQAHVAEAALERGRGERQKRLMEKEQEEAATKDPNSKYSRNKYSSSLDQASNNGYSISPHWLDTCSLINRNQDRSKLVEKFKSTYPVLPGELGLAYTSLRRRIDRVSCQEDFDKFLESYVEFSTQLKRGQGHANVKLVTDAELIMNADYLDRLSQRLHDTIGRIENSRHDGDISLNVQRLYAQKLKTYREDWWKLQALLVLADRADECSLCEEFPSDLHDAANRDI